MNSTNTQLRDKIIAIANDVFELGGEGLDLDKSPIDYDFESVQVVTFARRVNAHFNIEVKIGQILSVDDFESMFNLFENAVAQ